MIVKTSALLAILFTVFVSRVHGQSLFIPGLSEQYPITADNLGTDAQGRTTWRIGPGVPSGTVSEVLPAPSATLVEGPSDVHFVQADTEAGVTASQDCTLSNGVALCTLVIASEGGTSTMLDTFPVTLLEVQVATSAPGSAATSAPGSATTTNAADLPANTATKGGSNGSTKIGSPAMTVVVLGVTSVALMGLSL